MKLDSFKVSLIIPAHNEETLIGECLLNAIKSSQGKFYEILVIDNKSTDKTAEIASVVTGVQVIHEEKKGVMHARERGLHEAKGDFVAYIDADTRMPIGWLEFAEKKFSKDPNLVSLSGPYQYYDGTKLQKTIMYIFWLVSSYIVYPLVGYMILGGNFIARKETLLKIGGFDTNIAFYGDDTDTARRLHKYGKVQFKMKFFIYSSLRRIEVEGLLKTNYIYAMNFIWEVFCHKPFTHTYRDIRPTPYTNEKHN